jgi:hypothetical protein
MWRWMTVFRGTYDAALPAGLGGRGERVRVWESGPGQWMVAVRAPGGAELWRQPVPGAGWGTARRRVELLVAAVARSAPPSQSRGARPLT